MPEPRIDHNASVDDTKNNPNVGVQNVTINVTPSSVPNIPMGNWNSAAPSTAAPSSPASTPKPSSPAKPAVDNEKIKQTAKDVGDKVKKFGKVFGGKALEIGKKLSAFGMKELPILIIVIVVMLLLTWFKYWWCALLAIIACVAYVVVKKIPVVPGIAKLAIRGVAWLFTGLPILLAIIF